MTQLEGAWPVGPVQPRSTRMTKEDLLRRQRALEAAPTFAEIPKRHLRTIAKLARVRTLPPGAMLMKQGSSGSSFLVILEGKVEVLRNGRRVGRGSAGDFFGEISLLDPGPRTASVVAETPVTCLDLGGQDFRRIVGSEPALALRLLKGLAHRFREVQPALD